MSASPTIVVVDDDKNVGQLIVMCLEMAGFSATLFQDPEQFLQSLPRLEPFPDLLITDYQMPRLNGLELIQLAKSRFPSLRTISVSGTLSRPDIEQYPFKPDVNVPKPFRHAELIEAVKEALKES